MGAATFSFSIYDARQITRFEISLDSGAHGFKSMRQIWQEELEGEEDEQIMKLYGNTEMSFLTTTAITSITSYNNDKF